MLARVVWSRLARQQLLDLYVATGLLNVTAAERLYESIKIRVGRLAIHPRLGRRRTDIRPRSRISVVPPYLILYEVIPDEDDAPVQIVEIVAIVHGRRNLAKIDGSDR